jgi:CDP-paratose 2-epimerase
MLKSYKEDDSVKKLLITGAAGFIGTNCALQLANEYELFLIDDFSRSGSELNELVLNKSGLKVSNVDISNRSDLYQFLESINHLDGILNLAAQTSLLESYKDPLRDFESNALGTINLLDYMKNRIPDCKGIFLSSNKVYGDLSQLDYSRNEDRFVPSNGVISFDESMPLLPKGGYSISKCIGDMYVQEYGRRYGINASSLRQSAVYGPFQNPRSDQGWVAYFLKEFVSGNRVALRGEGLQVRDILYVDDFVGLVRKLLKNDVQPGEFFNVGGGSENSLSILELFRLFKEITGKNLNYVTGAMSSEDQKYFVSDNSKISMATGWLPSISPETGVRAILERSQE